MVWRERDAAILPISCCWFVSFLLIYLKNTWSKKKSRTRNKTRSRTRSRSTTILELEQKLGQEQEQEHGRRSSRRKSRSKKRSIFFFLNCSLPFSLINVLGIVYWKHLMEHFSFSLFPWDKRGKSEIFKNSKCWWKNKQKTLVFNTILYFNNAQPKLLQETILFI